jgi:hypothetical protein
MGFIQGCKSTLEHPGVKAPGTAKMIIFLLAASWAKLTLLVGESS